MASPDVVDLPDEEAVAHFRGKRDRQDWAWSFDWRDVSAEEHLAQFTFAKAARLDVLQAVRAEVDRALAEGRTLREFVGELRPRLQKLGWWGEKEMVDPRTGERRLVEIGPRRLATIFDTNLRMAHARGRWERIQALKEEMPYLRYVATLDARTRPEHARWHGTVLRVDDPWWRSHYPPNGWRCRCAVQQLSEGDLRRRGRGITPRPKGRTRKWTNRRTGEIVDVPAGIDPGFERNAGSYSRVAAARELLGQRVAQALPGIPTAGRLLDDVDGYAATGMRVRGELQRETGGSFHPAPFRAALRRRLRDQRQAGDATGDLQQAMSPVDAHVRGLVARATRMLPASWVRRANQGGPILVTSTTDADGWYNAHTRTIAIDPAGKSVGGPRATAIHEYVHHLQDSLPGFQALFRAEHIRRTTAPLGKGKKSAPGKRDKLDHSSVYGGGARYRRDDYVDDYFGYHYKKLATSADPAMGQPDGDALEVATRAFQIVLGRDRDWLEKMARHDPRMLDIVLGVLFDYDP